MSEVSNKESLGCAVRRSRTGIERAFTLVELLGVLAVLALLVFTLLPALAGTRSNAWRAQCSSNLKQIGTAFRLFEQDHNEMFPAAAHSATLEQLSWDSYLHRYLGGNLPDSDLTVGVIGTGKAPPALRCPADIQSKVIWVGSWFDLRSYAMVGAGPNWGTQYQVNSRERTYPLPNITLGVGMYWQDAPVAADWDAKSYRTSVVKDPAGTILLVEEPNGQNVAGSVWPCISIGPVGVGSALYQLDPNLPIQDPKTSTAVNQGGFTYRLHEWRFNYLFHDGHVEPLAIEQTIGVGTTNSPKGMWTIATGD